MRKEYFSHTKIYLTDKANVLIMLHLQILFHELILIMIQINNGGCGLLPTSL